MDHGVSLLSAIFLVGISLIQALPGCGNRNLTVQILAGYNVWSTRTLPRRRPMLRLWRRCPDVSATPATQS